MERCQKAIQRSRWVQWRSRRTQCFCGTRGQLRLWLLGLCSPSEQCRDPVGLVSTEQRPHHTDLLQKQQSHSQYCSHIAGIQGGSAPARPAVQAGCSREDVPANIKQGCRRLGSWRQQSAPEACSARHTRPWQPRHHSGSKPYVPGWLLLSAAHRQAGRP